MEHAHSDAHRVLMLHAGYAGMCVPVAEMCDEANSPDTVYSAGVFVLGVVCLSSSWLLNIQLFASVTHVNRHLSRSSPRQFTVKLGTVSEYRFAHSFIFEGTGLYTLLVQLLSMEHQGCCQAE